MKLVPKSQTPQTPESFTYLFKKVIVNVASDGISFKVKIDIHVFPESTGVVIPVGFGIPKSLEESVWLD